MEMASSRVILFVLTTFVIGTHCSQRPSKKKEIHLAGIFPINGVEGWQGGQVGDVFF